MAEKPPRRAKKKEKVVDHEEFESVVSADLEAGGIDEKEGDRSTRKVNLRSGPVRDQSQRAQVMSGEEHSQLLQELAFSPQSSQRRKLTKDQKTERAVLMMVQGFSGRPLIRMLQQQFAMNGGDIVPEASVKFIISGARGVMARHLNKPINMVIGEACETHYIIVRSAIKELSTTTAALEVNDRRLAKLDEEIAEMRRRGSTAIVRKGELSLSDMLEMRREILGDIARTVYRRNLAIGHIRAARHEINHLLGAMQVSEGASARPGGVKPEAMRGSRPSGADAETHEDTMESLERILGEAGQQLSRLENEILPV